jgi:hydroxyacylglutathione hydrolase
MTAVVPIPAFTDNYIWAIIDESLGVFDCVDPGDATPVLQFAESKHLKLRTILLTHHHNDHIGGVGQLVQSYPTAIVYGPNDPRIPHITHAVHEKQNIEMGQSNFKILFNPGHTSSHISYYEPDQGWLFCGDTLFSAGCGRVFDGTIEELHQSLCMFKNLPRSTKVFCGHEYTGQNLRFAQTVEPQNPHIIEYSKKLERQQDICSLPSTLELELSVNPFLRTDLVEVKNYASKHGAQSQDSLTVFSVLRQQKNNFS